MDMAFMQNFHFQTGKKIQHMRESFTDFEIEGNNF